MKSTIQDIIQVAESKSLTYQQKLFNMANVAERLIDPRELLGYSDEEMQYLDNSMICDLNEGYALYRPRYIVPDYKVFIENGCRFLNIDPPQSLDELLDGLLILYRHVPSITSFPVYIGDLDKLINPFIQGENKAYIKIKRFLNHIDKTIVDSFCHANIGPEKTLAGELILKAIIELENPTPNITFKYNKNVVEQEFLLKSIDACLRVAKPSFSNDVLYNNDVGEHAIVSCYNALPLGGGAYTLPRLRLGTIARATSSIHELLSDLLPHVSRAMLSMMDKRVSYIVEKSNFFETSFLAEEGFIKKENFTAMFGIVGLADAVNHLLKLEGIHENFGTSKRGDEIGHQILIKLESIVKNYQGVYVERTNNHYLLHGQVGASLHDEDNYNTPAHRIPVGDEPILPTHLIQAGQFHKYFPSGTGDLFAFDQTYLNHLDAVADIIKGAFDIQFRYISTYLQNSDLIRVTGYLVKRSEVAKVESEDVVLRDTDIFAHGTNKNAHLFNRKTRKDGE
ncbi:MAG: YjjI family glycine radical enzyme [Firmicutes bacterium HGW-Firmicutes-7]|nr:MAG: YjjI family glycine radical enzyme [Firmicutes bacterium HGW-Firmicutes-7]